MTHSKPLTNSQYIQQFADLLRHTEYADAFIASAIDNPVHLDQFGNLKTVEKTPIFTISGALPLSTLRNEVTTAGGGGVDETVSPGEIRLRTTASGTGSVRLATRRPGNYTPGLGAEAGIGVRRTAAPTGSQYWRAGVFDLHNGFFLGEDASGLYVGIRSNDTDTFIIRREDWVGDHLDGEGPSGHTLNLADGVIVEIDFSWYGYGSIEWYIVTDDDNFRQRRILVHRTSVPESVSIQNPNLPVSALVENGGTATNFDLFIGGRQYSVIGKEKPERRKTCVSRLGLAGVSTTVVPLVSFRPRVDTPRVQFSADNFDILASSDVIVSLWLNPTLTSASFVAVPGVPTTDTLLEVDVSATAMSGGLKLFEGIAAGSSNLFRVVNETDPIDFGSDGVVTLAARAISGTATVSSTFRASERW